MTLASIELWALRSAAVVAVLGLIAWRIFAAGESHIQAKWNTQKQIDRQELETRNAANKLESTNRQNDVLVAEAVAGQAQMDLADYRGSHPMRGSLSGLLASFCASPGPSQGAGNEGQTSTSKAAELLQSAGARDLERRLDETDTLLAEADSINTSYGICLATRPKAEAPAAQGQDHKGGAQ